MKPKPIKFTLEEVPARKGPNDEDYCWRLLASDFRSGSVMYFRTEAEARAHLAQHYRPHKLRVFKMAA
jgi:hypothetical protein